MNGKVRRPLALIPELPAVFPSGYGHPFPEGIVGSEIVNIGTNKKRDEIEGGGLILDIRKKGESEVTRVVFAFNELGMWVVS